MHNTVNSNESHALSKICREWYLSFGLLTLMVILSFWVPPLWMPLIELCIAFIYALFGNVRDFTVVAPCRRIKTVAVKTLVSTAVVSFVINIAYHTAFIHRFFDNSTLNHSIPYITSLIIFPISAIIGAWGLIPAVNRHHNSHCHLHSHITVNQPLIGRLVHATYRSLLRRLVFMSAVISIIDWIYYLLFYNNISINTPDRFFFFVVPAAIYIWSILYVRQTYSALALSNGRIIIANNNETGEKTYRPEVCYNSVILRLLVVRNDMLLLNISPATFSNGSIDTPFIEIRSEGDKPDQDEIRADFEKKLNSGAFKIRLLYVSDKDLLGNTVYHYLITVDENVDTNMLPGEWSTLDGINKLLKLGAVAQPLVDEIHRIYTISMAWKKYDNRGHRLYPIRNYQPTFRLGDIHNWDVDYMDRHWLKVAKINQDKPFWFIRKLLL